MGVLVGSQEVGGGPRAPGSARGASAGPPFHRLLIQRRWLAPNGGCEGSTCWNLGRKSVGGGSQVYDNRPMNPLWINLVCWSNRLEWKLMIGSGAAPTDQWRGKATWGTRQHPCGVKRCYQVGPRPPITSTFSFGPYLSPSWPIFVIFPAYK
jgi:hypothetical protein